MNNWQNCYQTIYQKNQTTQAETKHQMQNAYASITIYQPKSLTMMINTKQNRLRNYFQLSAFSVKDLKFYEKNKMLKTVNATFTATASLTMENIECEIFISNKDLIKPILINYSDFKSIALNFYFIHYFLANRTS